MSTEKYLINSIRSTRQLAKKLVESLEPGVAIFLHGPVGAGKSTLVRLILNEFGIDYHGSPTFGLMNRYQAKEFSLIHIDLYNKPGGILKEIYEFQDDVFLIEWPDNNKELSKFFPKPIEVKLSMEGGIRMGVIKSKN